MPTTVESGPKPRRQSSNARTKGVRFFNPREKPFHQDCVFGDGGDTVNVCPHFMKLFWRGLDYHMRIDIEEKTNLGTQLLSLVSMLVSITPSSRSLRFSYSCHVTDIELDRYSTTATAYTHMQSQSYAWRVHLDLELRRFCEKIPSGVDDYWP